MHRVAEKAQSTLSFESTNYKNKQLLLQRECIGKDDNDILLFLAFPYSLSL